MLMGKDLSRSLGDVAIDRNYATSLKTTERLLAGIG
jgi:hypothetical protein